MTNTTRRPREAVQEMEATATAATAQNAGGILTVDALLRAVRENGISPSQSSSLQEIMNRQQNESQAMRQAYEEILREAQQHAAARQQQWQAIPLEMREGTATPPPSTGGSISPSSSIRQPETRIPHPKKKVGAAVAIAHFASEKAKHLKGKLDEHEQNVKREEELIETKKKKLQSLKNRQENLKKEFEVLNKDKKRLTTHFQKVIAQLRRHPKIARIYTDLEMRVIVVTNMLLVKKDNWWRPKEIGVFHIRIDFSTSYHTGIQLLNVTKRCDEYDSPTILNTNPCLGNMHADIEHDFNTQNLYELIIDLIDYIESPKVANGYLGQNGDRNRGWEQFFAHTKKQPKDYSFEKHDQQPRSTGMLGGAVPQASISVSGTSNAVNVSPSISTTAVAPLLQQALLVSLRELGFMSYSAEYYTRLILGDGREGGEARFRRIDTATIFVRNGGLELVIEGDSQPDSQPMAVSTSLDTIPVDPPMTVVRYPVRDQDIQPRSLTELRRSGRLIIRVNQRYSQLDPTRWYGLNADHSNILYGGGGGGSTWVPANNSGGYITSSSTTNY